MQRCDAFSQAVFCSRDRHCHVSLLYPLVSVLSLYRRVRVLRDIFAFFGLNQQDKNSQTVTDHKEVLARPTPARFPESRESVIAKSPRSPEKRVAFALLRLRYENPAAPIQEAEGTCCLKQGQRMKLEGGASLATRWARMRPPAGGGIGADPGGSHLPPSSSAHALRPRACAGHPAQPSGNQSIP